MLRNDPISVFTHGWFPIAQAPAYQLTIFGTFGLGFPEFANWVKFCEKATLFNYEETTILSCPRRAGIVNSSKRVTYIKGVLDPCL